MLFSTYGCALLFIFLNDDFLTTEWITAYHQSRPGLKVLQQRIDEFITAHEAKLEQVYFPFCLVIMTVH